ncbi:hypothetical protein CK203_096920 [Vitis vinifera]|uniref:Uncharacterized protein n=1 Tax=Vitis vinifera TaxID=29760 RepID=A0A438D020_VITVI|nr:hypothetical protein CK203_096920 [Vitis vinifera]
METLSHLLSRAKKGGFIDGFLVKGRYDLVFMWFEACSGLKINLEKSELIPVGDVPNLEELAEVLDCKGGLGFRSLSILNKALLGIWSWRFMSEKNPLWKRVIFGKYGLEAGGWCTKEVIERCGIGIWEAIRNGWEAFKDKTSFQVGSGNKVKFWKDTWCRDLSLTDSFLDLYSIASCLF